jgi:probable rRNA maturation factor
MVEIEIQRVCKPEPNIPSDADLTHWGEAALAGRRGAAELVIRIVDVEEMTVLNRDYRDRDGPTNVLSFPFEAPPQVKSDLIGDLVICAPVVAREAQEQGKPSAAHWAHMVVHGVLHLLGQDHMDETGAEAMEGLEREILAGLGYPDPYRAAGNS